PVRPLVRRQTRHAPVVQHFSAAHGVAEMCAPIVLRIDIAHSRGDAAFGHYRMRLAQQRFANNPHRRALGERLDRCAQPCAARSNHQHIMFVGFKPVAQKSLTSWIAPEDTNRTYKSASPTEMRLDQANNMWCSFSLLRNCHPLYRGFPN